VKKHWEAVNEILSRKKKRFPQISIMNKGKIHTDPMEVATKINEYYAGVAPNLVKKLPKQKHKTHFSKYLKNPINQSFFCSPTSSIEIDKIINSLDKNKAEDIFKISIHLIKSISNEICEPLSHIINLSFSNGIFPEKLKIAKVVPIYKGGNKMEAKNYRAHSSYQLHHEKQTVKSCTVWIPKT